ncbi:MFS transporter [Spelaeicoccus albus]|nr:MFS transporter [Spelaeicoccus albus]
MKILLIGIGVGSVQMASGINVIMYYGQAVLTGTGLAGNGAPIAQIGPGIIAVIGAIIALKLMDRLDRRTTLLLGVTLTTISHILIAAATGLQHDAQQLLAILGALSWVFEFTTVPETRGRSPEDLDIAITAGSLRTLKERSSAASRKGLAHVGR